MICAIWHMLSTGETYRDLGGDSFTTRDPERQPGASSNSSNASDTTSRSRRPRQPERTFPVRQEEQRGTWSREIATNAARPAEHRVV